MKIKHSEKELYRIFTDLTKYGRTNFTYPDKNKRNSISRQISYRCDSLIHGGLMFPPVNNRDSRQMKISMSFIQLPIGIKLEEKKGNSTSIFFPRRKHIL